MLKYFLFFLSFFYGLLSEAQGPNLILQQHDSISLEEAESMFLEALQENDPEKQGIALYYKGMAVQDKSNTESLEYYQQATVILEPLRHKLLQDVYFNQAEIYTTFSEFPDALKFGFKSLEFNKVNGIKDKILRDMSQIGYIYDRMYEFKESIKWNREALAIAKSTGNKLREAHCYGRIGIAYDELAEKDNFNPRLFDSALYYNKKAAKLCEELNATGFARTVYSNIGNTYAKLKDFKKAEEYTLRSLAVPGYEDRKGVTLVNLGKIYLETGRYNEAKKVLDSAMRNTKKYGTRKYQLEAYYRFHELNAKKGDYKSALDNYISYKTIEDSILNETKTKQIAEIGERYKSADKERQILMQRAELAEQNLIIQKKNLQVFGLLGLAIVMSLTGFLFYSQQKFKNTQLHKENELKNALVKIETQNKLQEQRLRISRDLHDNIGAQLAFIISSIDNLKYGFDIQDESLKIKLENISDFTSTTIYELRDTIWAMNKSEITFEDLQTRISNYIDKAHVFDEKINFSFQVAPKVDISKKFTSVEGMNIYRVIQEAIHNSLKHSDADEIKVTVDQLNRNLQFEIFDNGKGFDVNNVQLGNGLVNMRKRVNDVGGELIVNSVDGSGTSIKMLFPS